MLRPCPRGYFDAESAFRDAIRANVGLAAAHMGLGWALRQLGARVEAEQEFRTGIALDASGVESHLALGSLLQDAMRYPEAEAEFREAIRLAPSSAAAHCTLGRLLASMGRHPEAEAAFRAAIGLQSGDREIGAKENLAALEREIGGLTRRWGYWAAALRQRDRQRRQRQRNRSPAPPGVRRRAGRGTWPPAGPDGRIHRRWDPASARVLLRSPRASLVLGCPVTWQGFRHGARRRT
jgi:tetratricopeptide (TPR) repeat protein